MEAMVTAQDEQSGEAGRQSARTAASHRESQPCGRSLRVTPADHVRMLADLLQPATPDLARRWLAALLMVPPEERAGTVNAVEARIVEQFGSDGLEEESLAGVARAGETESTNDEQGDTRQAAGDQNGMLVAKDAGARGRRKGTDARGEGEGAAGRRLKADRDATVKAVQSSGSQSTRTNADANVRSGIGAEGLIEVVHPPVQRTGYIEQVITTYEKADRPRIGAREEEKKKERLA